MGTSNPYRGGSGAHPLVPSFLTPAGPGSAGPEGDDPGSPPPPGGGAPPPAAPPANPPSQPPPADANRYRSARSNFTKFASSGGADRSRLGRSLASYVSTAVGGARTASARMAPSKAAGARLLGFLAAARERGAAEALREFHLETYAGRSIQEVFWGLIDVICPDGGTIDEGIAREAFVETVVDLTALGITDLDTLTPEQLETIFEAFVAHSIEARIYNDIGSKGISLPADLREVERVEVQLKDFIQRATRDALVAERDNGRGITSAQVTAVVDRIYEATFDLVRVLGEEAAS